MRFWVKFALEDGDNVGDEWFDRSEATVGESGGMTQTAEMRNTKAAAAAGDGGWD